MRRQLMVKPQPWTVAEPTPESLAKFVAFMVKREGLRAAGRLFGAQGRRSSPLGWG